MKKLYIVYLLLVSCLICPLRSQSHLERTLHFPQGPRALGLSGAVTGAGGDWSSLGYNPASVSYPGSQLYWGFLDPSEDFSSTYYSRGLFLSPWAYQNTTHHDSLGNQATLHRYTFGHRSLLNWGLSYNHLQTTTVDGATEDGWSLDFGLLFQMTRSLRTGIAISDFVQHNLTLHPRSQIGIAWWPFYDRHPHLMLTTDLHYRHSSNTFTPSAGLEFLMTRGLLVRAGINQEAPTLGFSLFLPPLELVYGTQFNHQDSGQPLHMLSVTFGNGVRKTKSQRQYNIFKSKGLAEFHLSGNLISGQSEISLFGGQKIGTNDLLWLIRMASIDPSCKGFIIRLGSMTDTLSSVALIQEIRNELLRAKQNDKKVLAYIEGWARLPSYYLASVADHIVIPELGSISHLGLELEITKIENFMSRFGFNSQLITGGAYKDSLHPRSQQLTDSTRALYETIVGDLYHHVLFDIKKARNLDWDQISHVFDGRIISARKAKKLGLVDSFGYWDTKTIGTRLDPSFKKLPVYPLSQFATPPSPLTFLSPHNRIAVIEIDGQILSGKSSQNNLFGGRDTGSDDIVSLLKQISKKSAIKGVLIRINSPGGSMLASDHISEALVALKSSGKKVYVSMGNVATSGGYYIAMAADKIYANRSTLTGSIGIIVSHSNRATFNHTLGIQTDTIKTGEHMDMFSNARPLTDKEVTMIEHHVASYYHVFTDKLKHYRQLTDAEIETVAQGQPIIGEKALELKLIDAIGSFNDAIDDLSQAVGIEGKPELLFFRHKPSNLDRFIRRLTRP